MTTNSPPDRAQSAVTAAPSPGPSEGGAATEIARLRREKAELVELLNEWTECAMYDAMMEGPRFKGFNLSSLKRCLETTRAAVRSATELPSVNWKDGEPYSYCPECGRREPRAARSATEGEPT